MKATNFNNTIKVRLTDEGVELFLKFKNRVVVENPELNLDEIVKDDVVGLDGFTDIQMWEYFEFIFWTKLNDSLTKDGLIHFPMFE